MNVVLFEDLHAADLAPISLTRPCYAITCGAVRLVDLVAAWQEPSVSDKSPTVADSRPASLTRPHLDQLVEAELTQVKPWAALFNQARRFDSGATLWLNARLAPRPSHLRTIFSWAQSADSGVVRQDQHVAALLTPSGEKPENRDWASTVDWIARQAATATRAPCDAPPLLSYPHDVVREHLDRFRETLDWRLEHFGWTEIRPGVYAARDVALSDGAITETELGPILLDQACQIGGFSVLRGPLYVGPTARVVEHAAIKDRTTLGATTKIGGEVAASVIEPFSNKQHHGYLGHSYVGSWVNLGAGTCNSDLKNTYGTVTVRLDGGRLDTGMQFFGCVVGDYTKTAINSSIFTGKRIGVGSMVYGFVTGDVPSFSNYAKSFGQLTEVTPEVLIATQQRMFRRRGIEQQAYHRELIQAVYEITRGERGDLTAGPVAF